MKSQGFRIFAVIGIGTLLAGAALINPPVRNIHNFEEDEGSYPDTDLVIDSAGNLYGMTVKGGNFDGGTVFQLSRSGGIWTHTVIHHFTGGADGGQPYGGVTLDAAGNVYGTAVIGGSGGVCVEEGCGVVFKLTKSGATWTHSVIHDFTGGSDGFGPGAPVSFDNLGNLYGMTATGGDYGLGVIYKLSPQPSGPWTENIIHHFTGGEDGSSGSAGRLLIDADRNIFGVATTGGVNGAGIAFEMSPSVNQWNFTTLYAFQGQPDGVFPYGGLVSDSSGNLYGTTYYGGNDGVGVVYKLTNNNGSWSETVLHSFSGGTDGASSISGLLLGTNGHLYGTTSEGGAACNCGTIFELASAPDGTWKERILHRFTGIPDGSYAYSGLVRAPNGHMFGATVRGGEDDDGMIFEFKP